MKITKNTGRLVGLLFLLTVVVGGWRTAIRGLSGARDNITAFLNSVAENISQMKLAIGLDMLGSAIAVFISIYLYPIIKKYSERLAITYVGIGFLSFAIIIGSNVIHWSLLILGEQYAASSATDTHHFSTMALIHYEAYYWVHFLLLMGYGIGGFVLYYFLLKSSVVPKWLAFWGMLAQIIVFIGGTLSILNIPVPFYLFLQNGIFILTFVVFLLIMGFRTEKYNALS